MDLSTHNGATDGSERRGRWLDAKQSALVDPSPMEADQPAQIASETSQRHLALLAHTIEAEIIPRLMAAHCQAAEAPAVSDPDRVAPASEKISRLASLVLADELCAASSYVDELLAGGGSLAQLCSDVLAPAARRLGELWEADLCEFEKVTLVLWRMQQLGEFGPLFPADPSIGAPARRLLLAPAPGEQHTLGLCVIAEFFRRIGWHVSAGPPSSMNRLCGIVGREPIDVLGLSIGCEGQLDALDANIPLLRQSCGNPDIGVMVGGPRRVEHPRPADLAISENGAAHGRYEPIQVGPR